MAITLTEFVQSREWNGDGGCTFHYRLRGTDDAAVARSTCKSSIPATWVDGTYNVDLVREEEPVIEPEWVDTENSDGLWRVEARFKPAESVTTSAGEVVVQASTGGATQHLSVSRDTVNSYAPPGETAPDYKQAIGVDEDGKAAGVDVLAGALHFSATKTFALASLPSFSGIFALTAHVNDATAAITDSRTGVTYSFAAGELLFKHAEWGRVRSDGLLDVVYHFAASPNETGLTVGTIVNIAKKGWDYLWVKFAPATDQNQFIRRPKAAYVEQVYETGAFSGLGVCD